MLDIGQQRWPRPRARRHRTQHARIAAKRAHRVGHRFGFVATRAAMDHHVIAIARQTQGNGAADAAR
jgi:hypothetical protein